MPTITNELPEGTFRITSETDRITAWASIGDGQPGSYLIRLDNDPLCINGRAVIGPKAGLVGRNLRLSASVADVSGATNWTSFTAFVQEGTAKPKIYGPYQFEVPHHLDTVVYKLQIAFQ